MNITLKYDQSEIDWCELTELYRIAPLGEKNPEDLKITFSNSMFKCFAYNDNKIVGVGRALADGSDCSYICDIAVHPEYQGIGLGKKVIQSLVDKSDGHKKIILYSNPGKEGFYKKLGFKKMNTAMAIFQNEAAMIENGTLSKT